MGIAARAARRSTALGAAKPRHHDMAIFLEASLLASGHFSTGAAYVPPHHFGLAHLFSAIVGPEVDRLLFAIFFHFGLFQMME